MPQNPLDILKKSLLPGGMPKLERESTEMERENSEFRAQAIQDTDPTWKKAGRHAIEALTGFFTTDPTDPLTESDRKHLTNPATNASQLGAIGGMLPLGAAIGGLKRVGSGALKLPIIAPEAYEDVKAGGLRLYSRLTDAMAKAPKKMTVEQALARSKTNVSQEEVKLRKLGEFLGARQPLDQVSQEEIMSHLKANPLELDVVRKGDAATPPAIREKKLFEHRLDTKYGGQWSLENLTDVERDTYNQLDAATAGFTGEGVEASTHWQDLQTPGPKENYGESLINLPSKDNIRPQSYPEIGPTPPPSANFQSTHWDEPNNLVWSRHNDRRLNPTQTFSNGFEPQFPQDEAAVGGSKGRFIEEIQSDWHQGGRDRGYKGRPETYFDNTDNPKPTGMTREVGPNQPFPPWTRENEYYLNRRDGSGGYSGWGTTPEEGLADAARYYEQPHTGNPVPDAPFKDTYHELALKQQLLDWANDLESEWFGVGDAMTASQMEGHTSMLGGPGVRPGMDVNYDTKHPTTLKKLLNPLGGDVEYANLPGKPVNNLGVVDNPYSTSKFFGNLPDTNYGHQPIVANGEDWVATALTDDPRTAQKKIQPLVTSKEVPGPGFWKASGPNKSENLKQIIKERGFPAMAALLAMQQAGKKMYDPEGDK